MSTLEYQFKDTCEYMMIKIPQILWAFQVDEIIRFVKSPPRILFQWGEILTALATVAISFLLMILYKRQQDQLAANHASILDVSSVEWDRDEATIYLSNYGNGAVKNLSLVTLMYVDNGAHRNYPYSAVRLSNQKNTGKWSSVIQDGEKDVPFKAKSRFMKPAPSGSSRRWIPIRFSNFLRQLKDEGATEVKYRHFIRGMELANERVVIPLPIGTRSIDLSSFNYTHSLESFDSSENIPSYMEYGYDHTFSHYYHKSYVSKIKERVYQRWIRLINPIIPKLTLYPRPLDALGSKRVRRVILKGNIRNIYESRIDTRNNNILVVDDEDQEDIEEDQ